MLTKLISKLSPQRRNRIVLEVRETNLPAQVFFRSLGFLATSVLRDFYQDTTEDAYLMHFLAKPIRAHRPVGLRAKQTEEDAPEENQIRLTAHAQSDEHVVVTCAARNAVSWLTKKQSQLDSRIESQFHYAANLQALANQNFDPPKATHTL